MTQRRLIVFAVAAVTLLSRVAYAQPSQPMVIGVLAAVPPSAAVYLPDFKKGLGASGFVEGKAVTYDYRWSEGRIERLPGLAQELVNERVALIASFSGLPTVMAAKGATSDIPVVFLMDGDPVQLGVVASMKRPGGNLTGVAVSQTGLMHKQLELMHELRPGTSPLVVLFDPKAQPSVLEGAAIATGQGLGRKVIVVRAASEEEFEAGFDRAVQERAAGVVVPIGALFATQHARLAALAARHALPTVFPNGDLAVSGGLMSYGIGLPATFHQLGLYAGKILSGAKPADLPVEEPSRIELKINLRTAKSLGLTIPPTLLARVDEMIE